MPETTQQPVIAENDALLELLRCPLTGERLRRDGDALASQPGGVRYPMRDGIALLLPGEAIRADSGSGAGGATGG